LTYEGRTALITGASSGLGEAFARQLAAKGANLVLVARSEDTLNRLAEALRAEAKVQVVVIAADLSSAEAVDSVAGVGVFEDFLDTTFAKQVQQVDLNVRALIALTHAFAPLMVTARRGGVINIASTAAFQPLAGATVYAASKAFVLFFTEALSLELEGTGVTVTAACPGPVATHFFATMNPKLKAKQMDQPGPVVVDILRGFELGKRVVYPGKLGNRLSTWGARLLPRSVILRLAVATTKKLNQT
jgi:short-subunit dehydrogenase